MPGRKIESAHQQQSFQALLQHVWRRSLFYRDYYSGAGIKEVDLEDITPADLPFIDKKLLMEHFDRAVTDPRLRKDDVECWIHENRNPGVNYLDDYIVVHSSGTSGNIAIFVCNRTDWQLAASAMAGRLPPPENYPEGKTKVAFYLASHGNFGGVSVAARMSRSIYDTLILSVLDSDQEIARKLNDFQPHQLHGYASSVYDLSRLAISGKLRIWPKRIVVGGDKLTDSMERDILRIWNVPIYDFYSTSESNYIALRQSGDHEMSVLDDLNVLEVLDRADHPVSANEEGRVVLTNLYNYTLPVIRYELGDYVSLGIGKAGRPNTTIKNIRGRVTDGLPVTLRDGSKDTINSHVLSAFYVPGIEKFQYVSPRLDYVQVLYISRENLDAAIRTEFQRILDTKGATKMAFEIRRVPRIANDPHTGKHNLVKIQHDAKGDRVLAGDELDPFYGRAHGVHTSSHSSPLKLDFTVLLAEQQATQAKSFHPSGNFVEFMKDEIELSVAERFEKIVQLYSQRIALKTGSQIVTYAELNAIANRIAREIFALRGSAQEPIALLLENGTALFAAMLGVLKTRKFFAAVDPSLPKGRIEAMLENLQATVIVTDRQHFALANQVAGARCPVLDVESIDQSIPATNLCLPVSSNALALVFYTSGSSGAAKAVLWTHQVLLHHLMLTTNAFHACAEDRLSLLASGTSGAVTNGLFALLIGAALLPFDVRKEGIARLAFWLSEERISICWFSPSLFRILGKTLTGREKFTDLRLIRLAGEAAYQTDLDVYKQNFPHNCVLVNALSSSEAGFLSIFYIDHAIEISGNEVPVGYSVTDKRILLLDEDGKNVGFDRVGEIAVRSRYLSTGYWRRPDLTDAHFRVSAEYRDERLYFTGDLGLMRPDGCLIYKGRKDFTTKIRGYRVEFAEIERALVAHTDIGEVVVTTPANESGEDRLVAYFTSRYPGPNVTELRSFLKKSLPDYMIPSVFVRLEGLPLAPNGKVDRTALPPLSDTRPDIGERYLAPRTPTEQALADIWAVLLKVDRVGVHDNFFDLGGHSLLATQALSRIRDQIRIELPLRTLFENSTVAGLALAIEALHRDEAQPEAFENLNTRASELK